MSNFGVYQWYKSIEKPFYLSHDVCHYDQLISNQNIQPNEKNFEFVQLFQTPKIQIDKRELKLENVDEANVKKSVKQNAECKQLNLLFDGKFPLHKSQS